MEIVIDPSAILAVLLNEQERDALVASTEGATLLAPASLPWEIGNALIAGLRRGRLDLEAVQLAWRSFEDIPIRLVEVDMARSLHSAAGHGLYAYDAYVLDVAAARRVPLLTLDTLLARAAERAGVTQFEWSR